MSSTAFSGATVSREYYINDAGAQMNKFGRSVLAAALHEPAPEDAYPGEYIQQLGSRVREQLPAIIATLRGFKGKSRR